MIFLFHMEKNYNKGTKFDATNLPKILNQKKKINFQI